jgi:hypothetical protein
MKRIIVKAMVYMMSAKMKTVSMIVIVAFISSDCASMFHGTKDTIYLRSDEPDTHYYCNDRDLGKGSTAFVTIRKADLSSSTLRAEKPGCTTKTTKIDTKFDATCLLGILIDWGIVSILIVDWGSTGAVKRAAQTEYVLTPDCPKQQPLQQQPEPQQQQPLQQQL